MLAATCVRCITVTSVSPTSDPSEQMDWRPHVTSCTLWLLMRYLGRWAGRATCMNHLTPVDVTWLESYLQVRAGDEIHRQTVHDAAGKSHCVRGIWSCLDHNLCSGPCRIALRSTWWLGKRQLNPCTGSRMISQDLISFPQARQLCTVQVRSAQIQRRQLRVV